jgi:hypothetical protein
MSVGLKPAAQHRKIVRETRLAARRLCAVRTRPGDRIMHTSFVVEIADQAVGLAIRTKNVYEFHALEPAFRGLDGAVFPSGLAAEQAARRYWHAATNQLPPRRGRRNHSLLGATRSYA